MIHKILTVYYSPTRTSAQIAQAIAQGVATDEREVLDLTQDDSAAPVCVEDTLVVIAAPVYAGRVAPVALERMRRLRGKNCPAILAVVYGNRDYEDALVELQDEVEALGFFPIAGGAFVGEHSFSRPDTPIAAGRPDEKDLAIARQLGHDGYAAWLSAGTSLPLKVKGNRPYREVKHGAPLVPECTSACGGCGECVELCPTHALTLDDSGVVVTDLLRCTRCCACVKYCPNGARVFGSPYAPILFKNCKERREPELFLTTLC